MVTPNFRALITATTDEIDTDSSFGPASRASAKYDFTNQILVRNVHASFPRILDLDLWGLVVEAMVVIQGLANSERIASKRIPVPSVTQINSHR